MNIYNPYVRQSMNAGLFKTWPSTLFEAEAPIATGRGCAPCGMGSGCRPRFGGEYPFGDFQPRHATGRKGRRLKGLFRLRRKKKRPSRVEPGHPRGATRSYP